MYVTYDITKRVSETNTIFLIPVDPPLLTSVGLVGQIQVALALNERRVHGLHAGVFRSRNV